MSEKTQKLFGGKTVSKYETFEIKENETKYEWDNEVSVFRSGEFFCLCENREIAKKAIEIFKLVNFDNPYIPDTQWDNYDCHHDLKE